MEKYGNIVIRLTKGNEATKERISEVTSKLSKYKQYNINMSQYIMSAVLEKLENDEKELKQ